MAIEEKKRLPIITLIIAIITVIIVAIVVVSMRAGAERRIVSKQMKIGAEYLFELNYEAAIDAFEYALQIDPKNEELYAMIIDAYECLGDFESAHNYAEKGFEETKSERLKTKAEELGVL